MILPMLFHYTKIKFSIDDFFSKGNRIFRKQDIFTFTKEIPNTKNQFFEQNV